jgi:ribose 5-phosphate isomerase B
LVCRSGGGMTITANKVPGVRAVPVYEPRQASHAVMHDHVNVISLAGDWITESQAKATLQTFLESQPSQEERHVRRVEAITKYETSRTTSTT